MSTPLASYAGEVPAPGRWSVKWLVGDVVAWRFEGDDGTHAAHLFVGPPSHGTGRHTLIIDGYEVDSWSIDEYPEPYLVFAEARVRLKHFDENHA